ncbi:MAG: hypothetical protein LBQ54_00230 [Planctomycetaceae bacterium]|jgi:hypothetical protein|nr:hypothetical protein [Planctomycetaceae bacterium]
MKKLVSILVVLAFVCVPMSAAFGQHYPGAWNRPRSSSPQGHYGHGGYGNHGHTRHGAAVVVVPPIRYYPPRPVVVTVPIPSPVVPVYPVPHSVYPHHHHHGISIGITGPHGGFYFSN